jgi:nickel-dependent lactate racemase
MQVVVAFEDERLELEIPEGRLVAAWNGPAGVPPEDVPGLISAVLENPSDHPPLRQAIVPGDHVVLACGHDVPAAHEVIRAVGRVFASSGVDDGNVAVLTDAEAVETLAEALPPGMIVHRHDPDDRSQIAYLASTREGRRVYLNRLLTDADLVVPIGRLAHDAVLGYHGPWGVIFPGMSDRATKRSFQAGANEHVVSRARPRSLLTESTEVSWLLGSQFQLGLVDGASGVLGAVAGLGSSVLERGCRQVDEAWVVRAESRAELVVVGIGRPGEASCVADVAKGLATATRLVQRGGKIVVLSRASGGIGPAMQRLAGADEPGRALSALRGHEGETDYIAARQLALALAWADVYVLCALSEGTVEDLSMIALERPEEARRLAALSNSCILVSQADRAWGSVAGEAD